MYSSYEVRWFFSDTPESLVAWFGARNLVFYGPEVAKRVDHYLIIRDGKNIGLKLREGQVEAKHLVERLGERQFPGATAKGVVEHWIKWSFKLDEGDSLSQLIIQKSQPNWADVAKQRLGYTYYFREDGAVQEVPIHELVPEGCQVELTRILVNNQIFHTFGLEAFSKSGNLERNLELGAGEAFSTMQEWHKENGWTEDRLGFGQGKSMGYPEFLLGL